MARGQKKSYETKIEEKEALISNLEVRLEKEKKELKQLINEYQRSKLETLNQFIITKNIDPKNVIELLDKEKCM